MRTMKDFHIGQRVRFKTWEILQGEATKITSDLLILKAYPNYSSSHLELEEYKQLLEVDRYGKVERIYDYTITIGGKWTNMLSIRLSSGCSQLANPNMLEDGIIDSLKAIKKKLLDIS